MQVVASKSINLATDELYLEYEGIAIGQNSFKKLQTGGYLCDNLIDIKINIYLRNLPEENRSRVHCFLSLFYGGCLSGLQDKDINLDRYTNSKRTNIKNVDIFALDFIIIPVNEGLHWSLCVVVRPILWMLDTYGIKNQPSQSDTLSPQKACLFFLDSLGMHNTRIFGYNIEKYLSNEWKHQMSLDEKKFQSSKASSNKSLREYSDAEMHEFRQTISQNAQYQTDIELNKLLFMGLPNIRADVSSQQTNGTDCGIFVYKFVEYTLRCFPTSFASELSDSFSSWIRVLKREITQAQVTNERAEYIDLLEGMREEYLASTQRALVTVVDLHDDNAALEIGKDCSNDTELIVATIVEGLVSHLERDIVCSNDDDGLDIVDNTTFDPARSAVRIELGNIYSSGAINCFLESTHWFCNNVNRVFNSGYLISDESQILLCFAIPVVDSRNNNLSSFECSCSELQVSRDVALLHIANC